MLLQGIIRIKAPGNGNNGNVIFPAGFYITKLIANIKDFLIKQLSVFNKWNPL
jgi:hypothetical protein